MKRRRLNSKAAEHRRILSEIEELLKDPTIPEKDKAEARQAVAKAKRSRLRLGNLPS